MTQPVPSPAATGLKYSDYAQGAAIITGAIGSATFTGILQANNATVVTGLALLATTILTSLSQWLQSKGD